MLSLYYNDFFFYISKIYPDKKTILLKKITFILNRMIFFNLKSYYIIDFLLKKKYYDFLSFLLLIITFNFGYFQTENVPRFSQKHDVLSSMPLAINKLEFVA